MRSRKVKDHTPKKKSFSRRDFIKGSATVGTATIAGVVAAKSAEAGYEYTADFGLPASGLDSAVPINAETPQQSSHRVSREAVLFAIGDTLIPSAPNDPGYKDLEWYGITQEVNSRLEQLPSDDLELFDRSSVAPLKKRFTELSDEKRAEYFNLILQGRGGRDGALNTKLKEIYSHIREIVFLVYYQNFPEDSWPSNSLRVPLSKTGDEYQITNPSTSGITTGWDLAGYAGPLTWEEEERRRRFFKKISWQG